MTDSNNNQAQPKQFSAEVTERFGVMPNFFLSAAAAPGLIEELWAFAKSAYLDSPLPPLFKERLFVHLSRFCEVRYCIVRHAAFLIGQGRPSGDASAPVETTGAVLELLRRPVPDGTGLAAALHRLEAISPVREVPLPRTQLEADLFDVLTVMFVAPARSDRYRAAVRLAFGERVFEILTAYLAFIRTAHYWTETHPELAYEPDAAAMLRRHPDLAALLLDSPEAERLRAGYALRKALDERDHLAKKLLASEEQFRGFVEATFDVLYRMSPDWSVMRQLSGGGFLADSETANRSWIDKYIHPDDQPRVTEVIDEAIRTKSTFELEHRVIRVDGSLGWVSSRAVPVFDANGGIREWFGAASDITRRKQASEQIQMLMREVNHRSKNMLSLIQAVARQTVASSPRDFLDLFEERVQALAAAQDLLVRNDWKGASLNELIRSQLAHFADLIGTRIELAGQPLLISASAAQTIGMAMHELATNAGKYGALSNDHGHVKIEWGLERAKGQEAAFFLSWGETGGPSVATPSRRGFGTTVITEMAEMSLGATVNLEYAMTGLAWTLRCEASEAIETIESHPAPPGVKRTHDAVSSTSTKPRVLVVEDEALTAIEIAHLVESAGFHVVGPARSVAQALALIATCGCDAAVVDINLHGETSEDIAAELAQRHTPFLTLSGYSPEQHPPAFKDAPALSKPLRPAELVAEIVRCLTG
jgi:two-component sensor histidine kinase/PAS domain-containing protein